MAEMKLKIKKEGPKYGVVEENGKWFIEPKYDKAGTWGSYIVIGGDNEWAVIDAEKGTWLEDNEGEFFTSVEEAMEYDALELVTDAGDVWYLFENGDMKAEYELEDDEDEEWDED